MLKFCTLFNSNYLSRGLAMYQSLEMQCRSFHLYVFAFDDRCYDVLSRLNLPYATIISLEEFENERLLRVKGSRTAGEYCWTCASSTIKYCLETYQLDHCTYIDADLLFFKDPGVLLQEMGEKSVLITPHRYTPKYDQSATSGTYCVQFMTFKNTAAGMKVLNWWVDRCIEWCYARFEHGKFGDQKYLDDWHNRFHTVHVLQHPGGGVAPWNVQQYSFESHRGIIRGREAATGQSFDLVFYHFHGFNYTKNNSYYLSNNSYELSRNHVKNIYRAYVRALSLAEARVSVPSYQLTSELDLIHAVPGRTILFLLRGYYKNFYKKTALTYGFFN